MTTPVSRAAGAGEPVEPVVQVEDLHVHLRSRDDRGRSHDLAVVAGVSFDIARGETLGLVGESGCGKTTLVRTLFGLNPIHSGTVRILGQDMARATRTQRRQVLPRIQMVFQDPYTALDPRLSAHDIVAEPLRINRRYDRARVVELVEAVGLDESALGRRPAAFSGGQRQRLGIARALALEPDLVVLDEPVSALDVSVQAQVVNLLQDLQRRLGVAYLFIAHDLSVVRHLSDRVAVMERGRFVETGTRDDIFTRPRHDFTRSLLAAVPVPDPHRRTPRAARSLSHPEKAARP